MRKYLLALLAIFFVNYCQAASVGMYSIKDFKWHNDNGYVYIDSIVATVQINPSDKMCDSRQCKIVIRSFPSGATSFGTALFDDTTMTTQQIVSRLNSFKGKTGERTSFNDHVCPYDYVKDRGNEGSHISNSSVCGGDGVPPQDKPDPVSCSVNSIVIDHGTLSSDSLDGHLAKGQLVFSCNNTATLHVSLDKYNSTVGISLGDNVFSKITMNGTDGGKGINIVVPTKQQYVPVEIISQLNGYGDIKAGSYQGYAVVKMNIL